MKGLRGDLVQREINSGHVELASLMHWATCVVNGRHAHGGGRDRHSRHGGMDIEARAGV